MQAINVPTENPVPQPNDKIMKKFLLPTAILLPFLLVVGGTLIWYFVLYQKPTSQITPGTTTRPSPSAGFGSINPYASLCAKFQKAEGNISCEKAVETALMQTQGNIINVSIESILTTNPNTSPPTRENINIWAVDFRLYKPLFIKELGKEVRVLRIGIPVNGSEGIYKKALE
jgi:hypothetical protein